MNPSQVLRDFPAHARTPTPPMHPAAAPMHEDAEEESEENQLLTEAAAALEKDPAQADLVGRIRDCLAKHASGEYGGGKGGVAVVVAPKG